MAKKPIIFSGPMVRALLDGRKSQTRRIVPFEMTGGANPEFTGWRPERIGACDWQLIGGIGIGATFRVGYAPGDLLWVREAWAKTPVAPIIETIDCPMVVYREGDSRTDYGGPWKPSIHMFRKDSRLTLRVTDVRVQRVQEISEADAIAEGIEPLRSGRGYYDPTRSHGVARLGHYCTYATTAFELLWDSLNAKRGYGWDENPWVAAYTFEVIRKNVDEVPG